MPCGRLPAGGFGHDSFTAHRLKVSLLTGAVSIGAAGLAACSTSQASSSAKVPLVVYSAQGYDMAMTAAFTKATGIPVKLDDNSTGPLLTQIEASRNNPSWGLLWVDGATGVRRPRPAGPAAEGVRAAGQLGRPGPAAAARRQELHADRRHPGGRGRLRQHQGDHPAGKLLRAAAAEVEGPGGHERPLPVRSVYRSSPA
jgi:hypothetical protein